MKTPRRILWTLTGIYWATCLVLTHLPRIPALPGAPGDKLAHLIAYGGLGVAWYLSLWSLRPRGKLIWMIVLFLGAAYGALDEITQPPFGRTCDFYDWLADVAGVMIAVAGMTIIRALSQRHVKGPQTR